MKKEKKKSFYSTPTFKIQSVFRIQINGHNQAIQSQHFSKNQDKDHAYEQTGLLGCTTYTSITNNSYSKASGQMDKSIVCRVSVFWLGQFTGNEDSNNQS